MLRDFYTKPDRALRSDVLDGDTVEFAALRATVLALLDAWEALEACAQQIGEDDLLCWRALPTMIPYRGHDAGCVAARAALAAGEGR